MLAKASKWVGRGPQVQLNPTTKYKGRQGQRVWHEGLLEAERLGPLNGNLEYRLWLSLGSGVVHPHHIRALINLLLKLEQDAKGRVQREDSK